MQERVTYTKITIIERWESAMYEWIGQAVNDLRSKDDARIRRESLIAQQRYGLRDAFAAALEGAIKQINASDYLMKKWSGEKVSYQNEASGEIEIDKPAFPQFHLTIEDKDTHYEVYMSSLDDAQSDKNEEDEKLYLDLDSNDKVFFKTENGKHLSVEAAVQYLLRPIVK